MSVNAQILADSTNPVGVRLTTFRLTYPRSVHSDLMTHRVLSRNSRSSRAVPPEKVIEQVFENPVIPKFYERRKGMGYDTPLDGLNQGLAVGYWLRARDDAVDAARRLIAAGADKENINRLLENWTWHTAIFSGTEWDNFFALRATPPDDQKPSPFVQQLAQKMQTAMKASDPFPLEAGQWHLPGLTPGDEFAEALATKAFKFWATVAAGRLARESYGTVALEERQDKGHARGEMLKNSGHWSPLEHPAMAVESHDFIGNFRGFKQLRKFYPHEDSYQALQDAQGIQPELDE